MKELAMWPFDQNNQPVYQQYAQGYDTGNYNGFDQNEAYGHVQQFMQNAPADMQQRVYQQHFEQMPYEQRMAFAQQVPPQYGMDPNNPLAMAQGFLRLGQEQPNILQQVFRHPLLLGSGAVLAGLIAKHMIDHGRREQRGEPHPYGNPNAGYGNPNAGYGNPNMGYGNPNMGYGNPNSYEGEIVRERREERREEQEERREEREEDRERHHHRRERDY
jgi:hypothetical protein